MMRGLVTFGAVLLVAGSSGAQPVLLSGSSSGDDVIVEARANEEADAAPFARVIWRQVSAGQALCDVQPLSREDEGVQLMLDRLAEAAIGAYLDARVRFTKSGVRSELAADAMARDINGMLSALIEATGADIAFSGLNASTIEQLDRLLRIDWSKASFGIDGGAEQDKYLALYYYVRTQRQELERQVRADLLPFGGVAALNGGSPHPGTTVRINSTCGTVFDEQNFLCALDLRLADAGGGIGMEPKLSGETLAALARQAEQPPVAVADKARVRKRDRWLKEELDAINGRIDRMDQRKELWELRDRMDDFDDRLTGLELEVKDAGTRAADDNPSANLAVLTGRNIVVRFERNSTVLEPDQRVLLNEVFEQLARSANDKVLITGYTDRSGDAALNLRLSEQRAKAVRHYLMSRGISAERLLVNYYGDSRSLGRAPDERRVEVEWIR